MTLTSLFRYSVIYFIFKKAMVSLVDAGKTSRQFWNTLAHTSTNWLKTLSMVKPLDHLLFCPSESKCSVLT